MTTTIQLTRRDVEQILEIMDAHDVSSVKVTTDGSSGIGQTTTVAFDTVLKEWNVTVAVDITEVGVW
jgi:hypothetical protein